jgi:hypothetical protein
MTFNIISLYNNIFIKDKLNDLIMAPGPPNSEKVCCDNGSDETSTSNEKQRSPFEPQVDILSNKKIAVINPKTTKINERADPEFFRDVCPYFAPTLCNLASMVLIITTGKPMLGGYLMFIGVPIYNRFMY